MRTFISAIALVVVVVACSKADDYSPDINNSGLLPNPNNYEDIDYGTQDLALEIAEAYSGIENDTCRIGLVYYDAETRTVPIMSLTGANWPISIIPLESGAIDFGFENFNTVFMPLQMTTKTKVVLELNATNDTIHLWGTNGMVRTSGSEFPIGTSFPESDDAELIGIYAREDQRLAILLDVMLPLPLKVHINGTKEE